MKLLTYTELGARWQCSYRSVLRIVDHAFQRIPNFQPANTRALGRSKEFSAEQADTMLDVWKNRRAEGTERVLGLKEIKRRAAGRGAK